MDVAGKVVSAFNGNVIKEPRGFIKIPQFILSIFAFATTSSFHSSIKFSYPCNNANETKTLLFAYPFSLSSVTVSLPLCAGQNDTNTIAILGQSESAPSQFYVFVGVMAFLYSIAAVILYVFFDDLYRKNNRLTVVDFLISVAIMLLWLISSSAWAQGVSDVKFFADPMNYMFSLISECDGKKCFVTSYGNFATLNVSIIFGFLNWLIWAGNLWFLFKETPWFKIQSKPEAAPGTMPPIDPQKV